MESFCLMCSNLHRNCLLLTIARYLLLPQMGQAFVLHLIFNQIPSRQSLQAVKPGVMCSYYANEKLQSTRAIIFHAVFFKGTRMICWSWKDPFFSTEIWHGLSRKSGTVDRKATNDVKFWPST